jgi:LysR family nitrogen assimilation transcriptional regulator
MNIERENAAPAVWRERLPAGRAPDLRELRYFHSVASAGNFGRAARELKLAPPSLTQQVQKLERELGAQLLIRHRRGVTLTPAGSSLMERVDVIMRLLNVPLEQAPAPEQTTGTLTLALPSESSPFLVPRLLQACGERWPNVVMVIREGSSASMEEWLLDRGADIAVLQDPPTFDELDVRPVVTERLGLVSGARVSSDTSPIRVRELAGQKLILPHARHWIRRLVESAAFRRGIVLNQVQQVDSVPLTKEMVRIGFGQTVLPYVAVRDEINRGTLSFRPIEHDTLLTVHAIACRGGMAPAPFVVEARDLLRDVMSNLASSGVWTGAVATGTSARAAGNTAHPVLEEAIE